MSTKISRREFFRQTAILGGSVGAVALLNACGAPVTVAPTLAPNTPAAGFSGAKLDFATLTFFKPSLNLFLQAFASGWAGANQANVNVSRNTLEELVQKSSTMAQTGVGPDLFAQPMQTPSLYPNAFVDLSDICQELDKRDGPFTKASQAYAKVDGVWRGIPWQDWPSPWNYRADYFEKAGWSKFPDTMDELLACAKDMKKFGKPIGLTMGHAPSDGARNMYAILWAFGAQEVDETGTKLMIDSQQTADALTYMQQLFPNLHDGVLSWMDPSNNQAFLADTCSAIINTDTAYISARDQKLPFASAIRHAPQPQGPGGRPAYQEGMSLGINAKSKNIGAAKAILRLFFEPGNFGAWLKEAEAYAIAPLAKYQADEYMPADPVLKPVAKMVADGRMPGWPGPFTPKAAEALNKFIIIDMMAKAAQGQNVKDVIAWGVNEYKQIYKTT